MCSLQGKRWKKDTQDIILGRKEWNERMAFRELAKELWRWIGMCETLKLRKDGIKFYFKFIFKIFMRTYNNRDLQFY